MFFKLPTYTSDRDYLAKQLAPGKWLIRPSRLIPNMFTIDYKIPGGQCAHARFAYVLGLEDHEDGWYRCTEYPANLVGERVLLVSQVSRVTQVQELAKMASYRGELFARIAQSMGGKERNMEFTADNLVFPSEHQRVQDEMYEGFYCTDADGGEQVVDEAASERGLRSALKAERARHLLAHEGKCPIGGEIIRDAVRTPSGHIFEKENIERWLAIDETCPMTRTPLKKEDLISTSVLDQARRRIPSGV